MIRTKSPSHKSVAIVCWGWGRHSFFTSEFCSAFENFILNVLQKFEKLNCFGTWERGQKAQGRLTYVRLKHTQPLRHTLMMVCPDVLRDPISGIY